MPKAASLAVGAWAVELERVYAKHPGVLERS